MLKIKLLVFGILLSFVNMYGQQTDVTLEEAIKKALQNNREIEIAKLDIRKAEAAISEAFGYALPSVDISGGFSHFIEKPNTLFPDFEAD